MNLLLFLLGILPLSVILALLLIICTECGLMFDYSSDEIGQLITKCFIGIVMLGIWKLMPGSGIYLAILSVIMISMMIAIG